MPIECNQEHTGERTWERRVKQAGSVPSSAIGSVINSMLGSVLDSVLGVYLGAS